MHELNDSLMRWAAQAGAEHLPHHKLGDYLAHVTHGVLRGFGRVEGFSVDLRSQTPGAPASRLRPGYHVRIEPVALVRVATRRGGRLKWSQACQWIDAQALAKEWRFAETTEVRDLLAEMDGYIEPARQARPGGYTMSPRHAYDLAPEKGR